MKKKCDGLVLNLIQNTFLADPSSGLLQSLFVSRANVFKGSKTLWSDWNDLGVPAQATFEKERTHRVPV